MPQLRSMGSENFEDMLDKKFSELATRESIDDLRALILEQSQELKRQNDIIMNLKQEVSVQSNIISKLEGHVAVLQNGMNKLKQECDNNQQYNRRLCLRIHGIKPSKPEVQEDGDKCLKKVKSVIKKLDVDIPDCCIDRAHRTGKPYEKDGVKYHAMIVRFTTWRHRSLVYKSRKNSEKYDIKLDLTKERLEFLKKCQDYVKNLENSFVKFVCADINCNMVARLVSGRFIFIESLDQLKDLCLNEY